MQKFASAVGPALGLVMLVLLIVSGLHPYERSTWFMETAPIFLAAPFLIWSWYRFPLTRAAILAIAVALSVSLLYELVEWGAAVAMGQGADAFLGTQGDPWDTQSDMGFALIGALTAMLLFTRWHDRQLLSTRSVS